MFSNNLEYTIQEQTHLCINPLHYEERLKMDVNHYIPKESYISTAQKVYILIHPVCLIFYFFVTFCLFLSIFLKMNGKKRHRGVFV